jgi:hypothetical protein
MRRPAVSCITVMLADLAFAGTLLTDAHASSARQEDNVEERRKVQTTDKRRTNKGACSNIWTDDVRSSSLTKEEMHRAVE